MTQLNVDPNFHDPDRPQRQPQDAGDAFYALLIDSHRGLSTADSELLNARLALLLANHVGDLRLLRQALQLARAGLAPADGDCERL